MRSKACWVALVMCVAAATAVRAEEASNWSGWRAGAFGGYMSGKVNSNDPTHALTTGEYKDDGGIAGVYLGVRHQSQGNLVLGAELMLPFYVFKGSAVDTVYFYSAGFVQSAKATHFMWQGGGGLDYRLGTKLLAGARVVAFIGARADHTMSWNEPGPNEFGYRAALVQLNLGTQF